MLAAALFGRTQELELLTRLTARAQGHVVLYGLPGIGKTRLVEAWAARHEQALLMDISPNTDEAVFSASLAARLALELEGSAAAGRRYDLAQALKAKGVKALILDAEQLDASLYQAALELQQHHKALSLVFTTRALPAQLLEGAETIALGPLDALASEALYEAASGAASSPQREALLARLDGHPLAIQLAAQLKPLFTPAQLEQRLQTDVELWDGESGWLVRSMERCWEGLDAQQQLLLYQICALPGMISVERLERCCQWEGGPLWKGAMSLLRAGLLCQGPAGPEGYQLRALESIRVFVLQRAPQPLRQDALSRLASRLERWGAQLQHELMQLRNASARALLAMESLLIRQLLETLEPTSLASLQACVLLGYAVMMHRAQASLFIAHSAQRLADPTPEQARSTLYVHLVFIRAALDSPRLSHAEAIERMTQVSALAQERGLEVVQSQATRALAHSLTASFQDQAAEEAHLRAVALAKRASAPLARVKALQSLGWFYGHTKRPGQAQAALREALASCDEADAPLQAAYVHLQLARSLGQEGFINEAAAHLEQVAPLLTSLPGALPLYLETKNLLLLRCGDTASALPLLAQVIEGYERLGHMKAVMGWTSLCASLHAYEGRWDEANAAQLKVLRIAQQQGDDPQRVRALLLLAACALALGQREAALGYRARAQELGVARLDGFLAALVIALDAALQGAPLSMPESPELPERHLLQARGLDVASYQREVASLEAWLLAHPESHWGRWSGAIAAWSRVHSAPPPSWPQLDVERGLLFLSAQDAPIDMARRGAQLNILSALMARAEQGQALSIWDAYALGWPDEQVAVEHMEHRVRVVISRLRSLGLKRHIQTLPQAYRWLQAPPDET